MPRSPQRLPHRAVVRLGAPAIAADALRPVDEAKPSREKRETADPKAGGSA
jgi:hypothetical protein